MATLTSTKIKNTYDALLKATDNDAIGSSAKQITDGLGNGTPLYISTTQIGIGVTPEATYDLHVYSNAKVGGDLTITGGLTVGGDITYVGSTNLTVKDPLIVLANNNTTSDALDIGFYGKYAPSGTTLYAGLFRDTGDSKFKLFRNLQEEPTTTVNTSGIGYTVATLVADLEGTLTGVIASTTTATTQSTGDNSTKVATTAYVDASIGNSTLAEVLVNGNTTSGTDISVSASDDITFTSTSKAIFGASLDLQVYSDGSNNYIDSTSNELRIRSNDLRLLNYGTGKYITADNGADVSLYYNNSKKLETTTSGITVTGVIVSDGLDLGDSEKIRLGTGNDLEIYHDGTNASFISNTNTTLPLQIFTDDLDIKSYSLQNNMIIANSGGDVSLYYNGSRKLYTTSTGVTVTGAVSATTFSGQLDGTISSTTTATTQIQGDNSTKVATTAYVDSAIGGQDTLSEILANGNTTGGTDIAVSSGDDITFADSSKSIYGAGSDLEVYSDASQGIIETPTGQYLRVNSDYMDFRDTDTVSPSTYAEFYTDEGSNSQVKLYYNSSLKFQTTSSGVNVTGIITADDRIQIDGNTNPYLFIHDITNETYTGLWSGDTEGALTFSHSKLRITSSTTFTGTDIATFESGGQVQLNSYGSGSFTGTATYRLAVDSSGDIIEIPIGGGAVDGSGTANYVTKWSDTDTITNSVIYDDGTNVGIGATPNSYTNYTTLTLGNTSGSGSIFDLEYQTARTLSIYADTNGGNINVITAKPLIFYTNGTEKMRIDSSGRVDITKSGTTAAQGDTDLLIRDSGAAASTAQVQILGGASGYSNLYFSDTSAYNVGGFIYNHTSNYLATNVNGSERMRIDSSGRVGIGETNPSTKVEIKQTNNDIYQLTLYNSHLTTTTKTRMGNWNDDIKISSNYMQSGGTKTQDNTAKSSWVMTMGAGNDEFDISRSAAASTTLSSLMKIESDGDVNIGNTSQTQTNLIVTGANSGTNPAATAHMASALTLYNGQATNGSFSGIDFNNGNNSVDARIVGIHTHHTNRYGEIGFLTHDGTSLNQVVRIDRLGNVGIGTSLPSVPLEIADSDNTLLYLNSSTANVYLRLDDSGSTNGNFIGATSNDMHFWTNNTERLRIDSSGNVGMGVASLQSWARLQVAGTAGAQTGANQALYVTAPSTTAGEGVGIRLSAASGSNEAVGVIGMVNNASGNAGSMTFHTYNLGADIPERMRITNDGNVGIGTNSPLGKLDLGTDAGQKLYVYANGSIRAGFGIDLSGSSRELSMFCTSSTGYSDGNISFGYRLESNGAYQERMRLTSAGLLGIGTTSPSRELDVENSADNAIISAVSSTTHIAGLVLGDTADDDKGGILYNNTSDYLYFLSNGSERMRITSGGSVGIGETNPTYRLNVKSSNNLMHVQDTSGTSNATFVLFSAPSYTPIGSITRNGSAGSILYNTSSDYRLKEDLQDFNALDLVDNITAYDYKWKDTEQRDYGFVAHELQEIMPNVVTGEKDGEMMQGVDYAKLTPVLLKAIQELKAEIETLKAQINN